MGGAASAQPVARARDVASRSMRFATSQKEQVVREKIWGTVRGRCGRRGEGGGMTYDDVV